MSLSSEMDGLREKLHLSVDYYRRHAARARLLADQATTPAIKPHLNGCRSRIRAVGAALHAVE